MKKIILLIISAFLLCGCSLEYNAYITDNRIEEQIKIEKPNYEIMPQPAFFDEQGSSEETIILNDVEYYKERTSGQFKIFEYTFSFDEYQKSRSVNSCLNAIKVSNYDNKYILGTSNYFSCFDLYPNMNDIYVNLRLDTSVYRMLSNNADRISNDVYTWNINKNNYTNKNIQLVFQRKDYQENKSSNKKESENQIYKYIFIIAGFIGVISIIVYLKIKGKI